MPMEQAIGLLALIISLYILWQIRQILLLVFAAVVLSTVLNRVVRLMQRYRLKRGVAIAITVAILLAAILGFSIAIVPRLAEQLQQLIAILPQVSDRVGTWSDWLLSLIPGTMLEQFQGLASLTQQLQVLISQLLGNFLDLLRSSFSVILNLLLFLVLTIMLLANPSQYRRVLILGFPAFYRRRIDGILAECETSLVGWIKGTLLAMLVIGLASFIGLSILQIPLPLVNASLAGLLEFIPNVGPTLSVITPALLALLDSPWKALGVIILYILIQQFESLILVPLIMQK